MRARVEKVDVLGWKKSWADLRDGLKEGINEIVGDMVVVWIRR